MSIIETIRNAVEAAAKKAAEGCGVSYIAVDMTGGGGLPDVGVITGEEAMEIQAFRERYDEGGDWPDWAFLEDLRGKVALIRAEPCYGGV